MTLRPLAALALVACGSSDHDLPPYVRVLAPADGVRVNEGDPLLLEVRLEDDRPEPLRVRVTSDRDGVLHVSDDLGTPRTYAIPLELRTEGTLHLLTVTATDVAGNQGTDEVRVWLNGAPTAPVIEIRPEAPGPDDDVVAEIVRHALDPEGSPVGYDWAWSLDGVDPHAGTRSSRGPALRAVLPARSTEPGQTWTITVVAWEEVGGARDPHGATSVTRRSVTIGEAPDDTGLLQAISRSPR